MGDKYLNLKMEKDKTLIALLEKLKSQADFDKVEFVDNWDGDHCAIGFKREVRLVYLSTWNFSEGISEGYDYDFELLDVKQPDKLNVLKEARNVSEVELIADIKEFLDI